MGASMTVGVTPWIVDDELGSCVADVPARRIIAHELGHVLGLGHSCDEAEACTSNTLRDALMYWTTAPCEAEYTPQEDDLAGLSALYAAPACDPRLLPADTGSAPSDDTDLAPIADDPVAADDVDDEPGGCVHAPAPAPVGALVAVGALLRRRRR